MCKLSLEGKGVGGIRWRTAFKGQRELKHRAKREQIMISRKQSVVEFGGHTM